MGVMQDRLIARSELAMLALPFLTVALPLVTAPIVFGTRGAAVASWVLVIAFFAMMIASRWRRRGRTHRFANAPDANARIKVVGGFERLKHVLVPPPHLDEPESFFLLFATPERHVWRGALMVVASVACGVCTAMIWPEPVTNERLGLVVTAIGVVAAFGIGWPSYVRVAPGRLDVLRGGLTGSLRVTASVDLRQSMIFIDLNRDRVFFKHPGRRIVWFSTALTGRRCELAKAIVAAATSRRESIPLPSDALVG